MTNQTKYYHPKLTKQFLAKNHFKYSYGWSDEDDPAYIASFPVYRYYCVTTLELRIVVYYNSNQVKLDVIDVGSRGIYAPWYRGEAYKKYPLLREVDKNIEKIMKSLGFKKIEEEDKNVKGNY